MAASSSLSVQTLVSRVISNGAPSSGSPHSDRLALPTGFRLSSIVDKSIQSPVLRTTTRRPERRGALDARAASVETIERKTATDALVEKSVNSIRFLAIDVVEKANSSHPGLPMGCAPMGHILYDEVMRYNPNDPYWFNRDCFVLSTGHGCMLQLKSSGFSTIQNSFLCEQTDPPALDKVQGTGVSRGGWSSGDWSSNEIREGVGAS